MKKQINSKEIRIQQHDFNSLFRFYEPLFQKYIIVLQIMAKLKLIILVTLAILLLQGNGQTVPCPNQQLCADCTATTCNECYQSFLFNTSKGSPDSSGNCPCPDGMWKNSDNLCYFCPITCKKCTDETTCTGCIGGYEISNNHSCIPKLTNSGGWVSKNISYDFTSDHIENMHVDNFKIIKSNTTTAGTLNKTQIDSSDIPANDLPNYFHTCSKFSLQSFFGLNHANTQMIKTIYNVPPHQWINIRVQAFFIDNWQQNYAVLELNAQNSYDEFVFQEASDEIDDYFSTSQWNVDFCESPNFNDGLSVGSLGYQHSQSSIKFRIRTGLYNQTNVADDMYYGIRQIFVRVGTCPRNCKSCDGPNHCMDCIKPYILQNSSCICDTQSSYETRDGCLPFCQDGLYYDSTDQRCVKCSNLFDNCRDCDATSCSECIHGYYHYTESGTTNTQCLANCPQAFKPAYKNTTSDQEFCEPCAENCSLCKDDVCLKCSPNFYYQEGVCKQTCPAAHYQEGDMCVKCAINCLVCLGADQCQSCSSGYEVSNGICKILCTDGVTLYENDPNCTSSSCGGDCVKCIGNICLQCTNNTFLSNDQCQSSCESIDRSFFVNASSTVCLQCPRNCKKCIDAQKCEICRPGYYLNNQTYICNRECPLGTYHDIVTLSCQQCTQNCQNCKDGTICHNCKSNYFMFDNQCRQYGNCPLDYEFDSTTQNCIECPDDCEICRDGVCLSCQIDRWVNSGSCVEECPVEKYRKHTVNLIDGVNVTIDHCEWKSPLCEQYSTANDGSCEICAFTMPKLVKMLDDDNITNCQFSCVDGYAKTESGCTLCPQNCLRCDKNLACLQCQHNYVINTPSLITNITTDSCVLNYCISPYYSDSIQCQQCLPGCQVCELDGSCFFCLTGYEKVDDLCVDVGCEVGTFLEASSCLSCNANCKTCTQTPSKCTSCNLLVDDTTSPPTQVATFYLDYSCLSTCPTGYFDHKDSLSCRKCNPKCIGCLSISNCTACQQDFYLLDFYDNNNAQCISECPQGFYADQGKCHRCYKDCQSCYGPSQYHCLSCYPNFKLDQYKCVWQCAVGKYEDDYGYCDWCHPGCLDCDGPTQFECISCESESYFYNGLCYQYSCPGATYLAYPQEKICEACQFGCTECVNSQFCHFCTPGYNLYKGWCYLTCPFNLRPTLSTYNQIPHYICGDCQDKTSVNCQTCDSTGCQKCKTGFYLDRSSVLTTTSSDGAAVVTEYCVTTCPDGTYASAVGECQACQSSCLTCNSYTNCITCTTGFFNINGFCSTTCPQSTFINNQNECQNCPSTCTSCTSRLNCSSCISNYFIEEDSVNQFFKCVQNCPASFYGDESGRCSPCAAGCTTCVSPTECTTCTNAQVPVNGICDQGITSNCSSTPKCSQCSSAGKCLACNQPYLLLIFQNSTTQCLLNCPTGFFNDVFNCKRCNSTCASCQNTMNNCSSCQPNNYLLNKKCLHKCPLGYTVVNNTCQNCPTDCLKCQGSNCLICERPYILSNSSCVRNCPPNTFYSCQLNQCISCSTNCSECRNINKCSKCTNGSLLMNDICVQICPKQYYEVSTNNNGAVCKKCQFPCMECSDQYSCLTCPNNYILNGTKCQLKCPAGHYRVMKYSYSSNTNFMRSYYCKPCAPNCAKCTSFNKCFQCKNSLILHNHHCLKTCPSHTFFSDQDNTCKRCQPYCKQCQNATSCIICHKSTVNWNGSCIDSCPDGNYAEMQQKSWKRYSYWAHKHHHHRGGRHSQFKCKPCSMQCKNCWGPSKYSCTECSSGYFKNRWRHCVSNCTQGFYQSNYSRSCRHCPYSCKSCTRFRNCTECKTGYTMTSTNRCISNNTCNMTGCSYCLVDSTNMQQCQQCKPGYYLYSGTCHQVCPSSTFGINGDCMNCSANCTQCNSQKCTNCSNTTFLYRGQCYTSCPSDTILMDGQCHPDPCIYYNGTNITNTTNNKSNCSLCTSPYLLHIDSTINQWVCTLKCPQGTVQSQSQCLSCPENCSSCLSPTVCLNCTNSSIIHDGQCIDTCPSGTFNLSGKCANCQDPKCLSCSFNSTSNNETCYECDISAGLYLFQGKCYYGCPQGTYEDQFIHNCVNCSTIGCQKCLNSSFCESCSMSTMVLVNGLCLDSCPPNTYHNGDLYGKCLTCPQGCMNCTSQTHCQSCLNNYIYTVENATGKCLQNCPTGTYKALSTSTAFSSFSIYTCEACPATCISCYSQTHCSQCIGTYSLKNGECVSQCPAGSYHLMTISFSFFGSSLSITICRKCSDLCKTCEGASNFCTSCNTGYALDDNNNCISSCTSTTVYYNPTTLGCYNCSPSCYSCSSYSNCLSCNIPKNLYNGRCLSNCPFGYFANNVYQCLECGPNCASCSGDQDNCTSCYDPKMLQIYGSKGYCSASCQTSYYFDTSSSQCLSCESSCLTCDGSHAQNCTSCPTTTYLTQTKECSATCPTGYTPTIIQGKGVCKECHQSCQQCTYSSTNNSYSCQNCKSPYNLYDGSCVTTCPTGTYMNDITASCLDCPMEGCFKCILNTSFLVECTACKASYYMIADNNTCVDSCPTDTYELIGGVCVPIEVCSGYTYQEQCLDICPLGTYPSTVTTNTAVQTRTCNDCSSNCQSCDSISTCQSCQSGWLLMQVGNASTCTKQCPLAYYSFQGKCLVCESPCLSCQASSSGMLYCLTCATNFTLQGTDCVTECDDGYFNNGNKCEKCPGYCSQCSDSRDCTACANVEYAIPGCTGNCTDGQYRDLNNSCADCSSACATCYGPTDQQCLTCNGSGIMYDGTCITQCLDSYYQVGSTCVECPSSCATCSLAADSITIECGTCNTGYLYAPITKECKTRCSDFDTTSITYYQSGSQCLECTISDCANCQMISGNVSCMACNTNTYFFQETCLSQCPLQHYSVSTTTGMTCQPCQTNCKTCTSSTNCLTCNSAYFYYNDNCLEECPVGTFRSNNTCIQCEDTNCYSCSNSTACQACTLPYVVNDIGQCLDCTTGFYMDNSICRKCMAVCLTCAVNSYSCTSCYPTYYAISMSGVDTCVSNCPSTFFATTDYRCESCPATCNTCTNATYCKQCDNGLYLTNNNDGSTTCSSSCPSATYSYNNICYSCSLNCTQCTSANSCQQCSATSFLYNGFCIDVCPSGYADNGAGGCSACGDLCKVCASLTNCTVCQNNNLMNNGNGTCSVKNSTCSVGQYTNSLGTCSECYSTCKTCSQGGQSDCLTCFDGYQFESGVCVKTCPKNQFHNKTACTACTIKYGSQCISCNIDVCLSCEIGFVVNNANNTGIGSCQQSCPPGTYSLNQQCQTCPALCATCVSSTQCNNCTNSSIIFHDNLCYNSCPNGTFNNGTGCQDCDSLCTSCSGSASNCDGCVANYFLNNTSCLAACPNGTYASNATCIECSSNCQRCSNSTLCSLCETNFYLLNGTCRSNCIDGYFQDTQTCVKCVAPCNTCSSITSCLSCIDNYTLSGTRCSSDNCTEGEYYNITATSCQDCALLYCSTCTNNANCLSCQISKYTHFNSTNSSHIVDCNSNCPSGTYGDDTSNVCQSCFTNCQTCTSSTTCEACQSGFILLSISSIDQCLATCPVTYYNSSNTCTSCMSNCDSCTSSTTCTTCSSNYYILNINSDTQCVSTCPSTYFTPTLADGNGICGSCSSNCKRCYDSNTCYQCISSTYSVYDNQCIPYNCVNCFDCDQAANQCNQCNAPYYIYNKGCTSPCPETYYGQDSTNQCTACIDLCIYCKDATTCQECVDGYAFADGSCQNQGFLEFGALGNMSGFTSNVTEVMSTVYASSTIGPIAGGEMAYGPMGTCQQLHTLKGLSGGNEEVDHFLDSLQATSFTTGDNNTDSSSSTSTGKARRRMLVTVGYNSSFLETNLPIFIIIGAFLGFYLFVFIFNKYQESCCSSCPNLQRYMKYICQFMEKRFKWVYFDVVMWISYLPFLYYGLLQLQKGDFSDGLNVFSFIVALVVVIAYPLYPIFIVRQLLDKHNNLEHYQAITHRVDPEQSERDKKMCDDFECCPKENPDTEIIEMSLSPFINKVKRPIYDPEVDSVQTFRWFTIPHFRLIFSAINYFRKFLFAVVVATASDPLTGLSILVVLSVLMITYYIALRPRKTLYFLFDLLLEIFIFVFELLMLIYVATDGAKIGITSIITHAVGFIVANTTLLIAIILNLIAYYHIFCCIIDLCKHVNTKVEDQEEIQKVKQIAHQLDLEEKDLDLNSNLNNRDDGDFDYNAYNFDEKQLNEDGEPIAIDKELGTNNNIKKKKKVEDDEITEQNPDEQDFNYDPFNLEDEKDFNVQHSSLIAKKSKPSQKQKDVEDFHIRQSNGSKKVSKQKIQELSVDQNTSEDLMGKSKLTNNSQDAFEQGLLKQPKGNYKRQIAKDNFHLDKGQVKEGTGKYRRKSKKNTMHNDPDSEENIKYETEELRLQEKVKKVSDFNEGQLEDVNMKDRAKKNKSIGEADFYDHQNKQKVGSGKQIENVNMKERIKKERVEPFADFEEILKIQEKEPKDVGFYEKQKKDKNNNKDLLFEEEDKQVQEGNMKDRNLKQKKQNKFYKNSDDQEDIGEVKTYEKKGGNHRRNRRSQQSQKNIQGVGKNITTGKRQKQHKTESYQPQTEEGQFKDHQGKKANKSKNQEKQEQNLQGVNTYDREKKVLPKQPKSFFENVMEEPNIESVVFEQKKKKAPMGDNELDESQMQKRKKKEEKSKSKKDNLLNIEGNYEQTYEDVVKKNKQEMFKQNPHKKSTMNLIDDDDFEEVTYERPESKMEKPRSRKDSGFSTNSKNFDDSEDDGKKDIRKGRSSAIQRLRKRGNMNLNENQSQVKQREASQDSKRISKLQAKKKKATKSGVLNISDTSDIEDMQQIRF